MWQSFHSYAWQVVGSDREAVDYSSVQHRQPHTASITLHSLLDSPTTGVGLCRWQLFHDYSSFRQQSAFSMHPNPCLYRECCPVQLGALCCGGWGSSVVSTWTRFRGNADRAAKHFRGDSDASDSGCLPSPEDENQRHSNQHIRQQTSIRSHSTEKLDISWNFAF